MAKRRTFKPRKKGRSAAQKAATRRMLAANKGARSSAPKRRRKRRSTARAARRVTSSVKRVTSRARRSVRRARRSFSLGGSGGSAVSMLSNAAMMGVGAVGVDIAMGQVAKFLPTGWDTPIDAGGINYKYYAAKAAVALGIGIGGRRYLGGKLGDFAMKAAQGSLAVMTYNLAESFLPAGTTLGFSAPYRGPVGAIAAPSNVSRMPIGNGRQSMGAPPVYNQTAYRGPVG